LPVGDHWRIEIRLLVERQSSRGLRAEIERNTIALALRPETNAIRFAPATVVSSFSLSLVIARCRVGLARINRSYPSPPLTHEHEALAVGDQLMPEL